MSGINEPHHQKWGLLRLTYGSEMADVPASDLAASLASRLSVKRAVCCVNGGRAFTDHSPSPSVPHFHGVVLQPSHSQNR